MATLQQTVRPAALGEEKWLRTKFASDDDLHLPVSIYLDSNEDSKEIIEAVARVLRAYHFSNISRVNQAPGSFYIRFEARFEGNDRKAARQNEDELKADLLGKEPPKNRRRQRAVKRLKASLSRRAKRSIGTAVIAGVVFIGSILSDVIKDGLKDGIEVLVGIQGPMIAQRIDAVVAKELPPGVAASVHKVVREYIERSPNKSELPPPSEE